MTVSTPSGLVVVISRVHESNCSLPKNIFNPPLLPPPPRLPPLQLPIHRFHTCPPSSSSSLRPHPTPKEPCIPARPSSFPFKVTASAFYQLHLPDRSWQRRVLRRRPFCLPSPDKSRKKGPLRASCLVCLNSFPSIKPLRVRHKKGLHDSLRLGRHSFARILTLACVFWPA